MAAKQTINRTTTTKTTTKRKTTVKRTKSSNGSKRCPTCGKFM